MREHGSDKEGRGPSQQSRSRKPVALRVALTVWVSAGIALALMMLVGAGMFDTDPEGWEIPALIGGVVALWLIWRGHSRKGDARGRRSGRVVTAQQRVGACPDCGTYGPLSPQGRCPGCTGRLGPIGGG